MTGRHPLLAAEVRRAIERAASGHRGRAWTALGFTDLNDRASHPCGIYHGQPFSVFAKLSTEPDARRQFATELDGLRQLASLADVATPVPVATGLAHVGAGWLLVSEALPERRGDARSQADLRSIGTALARLHLVGGDQFGLAGHDGFFGSLPQDNRPVATGAWTDFYVERRLMPMLRLARDSGNLPPGWTGRVEAIAVRLPALAGQEPRPSLLHGDAQQNNFLSAPGGAVIIDACPYFGHPELDLALLECFEPVPPAVFDAYRETAPLDPGFESRRELWRLFSYLAVAAVEGQTPFGRRFLAKVDAVLNSYA